ncbi:MAG: hypothetical protein JNK12_16730 [Acidimicrobiales bacterium]|nr:hypothetical protein [Acidimicrobiales bacterium]
MESLELEIEQWRSYVGRRPGVDVHDVEELESHLRDQIADLHDVGLADDEAFLVAVKRLGSVDDLSHEYAREHSGRLWKQLVLAGGATGGGSDARLDAVARAWPEALGFAVAAAVALQIARLLAGFPDDEPDWLFRNASLFVLPFLAAWFARRRRLSSTAWLATAGVFAGLAVAVNVFPYDEDAATEVLVATHLPVLSWCVVAFPFMGATLRSHERRMDMVRFTGEWCIYYALIAFGGGVLLALTLAVLEPTGIDPDTVATWLLLSGAAGAVIVAAWLVEAKQQVVENMAPVLTMLFTPLFAAMLVAAAVAYAVDGLGEAFDRELVGVFDALMVAVLGLVLYGLSAREPSDRPGWMDRIQLVAVVSALALDVLVLGSMVARIGDLGLTPNRVAALGLNLLLLVNLAGAAWLSARFLAGRTTIHRLERWQTSYLPVFAAWVAVVVLVLPPAFAFS